MNIFAYLDGETTTIKRIPLTQNLQGELTAMFEELMESYIPESNDLILDFKENINYKPDDEVFVINNFEIPESLLEYIRNPSVANVLSENDYERIKYLFLGKVQEENTKLAFIVFDKKKIIRPDRGRFWIQYRDNTFSKFDQKAIAIDRRIDALYKNGNLYFRSLYNIKRIFGELIEDYYREATDDEVRNFANNFFNEDLPEEYIDSRSRKLIFGIVKSGASYNLSEIIEVGRSKFGLSIELDEENGKLDVPPSKREFKKLLKLLNDDLLESPLTQAKYETNSKRRIA